MKRELIIRVSFALFVLFIFIIVELLNNKINSLLGTSIESKYFLPLISFLFYDLWIKYFEIFTVTLGVRNSVIKEDIIEFEIIAKYRGKGKLHLSLDSLSGIRGYNPELIYSNTEKQEKKYNVPENFEILINEDLPVTYLKLKLNFKDKAEPRFTVPLVNLEIFIILVTFIIGDKKRTKRVFLFRRNKI